MLQTDCEELLSVTASFFTDVLRGSVAAPASWKRSKVIVLYKKGDAELCKNYRPIAIIPVLCKLYSSLVLSRVHDCIEKVLPSEQAGFRSGMGCADHLHTLRLCAEKARE